MYGPPPSPLQVLFVTDLATQPFAWVLCGLLALLAGGLAWRLRERPTAALGFASLAHVLALTAPLAGLLSTAVYGAYPTLDKQGSLLFYQTGVHRWALLHPLSLDDNPAVQLIGVHLGHLWLADLFDRVLPTFGAFNAQGLLYLVLGTWCAALFLRTLCNRTDLALALALPFGLGLHIFRDLNWYTIEKAAVFVIPLYALCWMRTLDPPHPNEAIRPWGARWPWAAAATVALASWLNLYLGFLLGFGAGFATLAWGAGRLVGPWRDPHALRSGAVRLLVSYAATLVFITPLLLAQAQLMRGQSVGADPECFLWQRAALDTVEIWPLRWNRLELWRACDPAALGVALWGLRRAPRDPRVALLGVVALGCTLLALGPQFLGLPNPVYLAAWHTVPFFWRIAKPETFFHLSWLALLGIAACTATSWPRRRVAVLYAVVLTTWLVSVRTHPVYPEFTEFVPSSLAPGWENRVQQHAECQIP